MRIQRAGTAYVRALAELDASALPDECEVALSTFHGAARELTRVAGPAALAENVLAAARSTGDESGPASARTVIWF